MHDNSFFLFFFNSLKCEDDGEYKGIAGRRGRFKFKCIRFHKQPLFVKVEIVLVS